MTRRYVPLQEEAKAARRGIWGGQMQKPEDYRREKRQQSGGQGGRPPSHSQQGYQPPQGAPSYQASGGHAAPSGGSTHWLVKLLESVVGACLGKGHR